MKSRHLLNTGLPSANHVIQNGKGDMNRVKDLKAFEKNYARIFGKKGKKK